jgi:hypothetical protein
MSTPAPSLAAELASRPLADSALPASSAAYPADRVENTSFDYLLDKIGAAEFENEPFPHLYIRDFFNDEHFSQITGAPEIALRPRNSDDELFDELFGAGYKIIDFPGCITNKDAYINWHRVKGARQTHNNSACEGFGVTLRLMSAGSPFIAELMQFINSQRLQEALAAKFGIDLDQVIYDAGIQKYLDGYEISPHPDIRKKALTYMVNVNPGSGSEEKDHHTHYLAFRDAYKYVQAYWEGHPEADRCWVPWNWCDTRKMQRENNSIVVFSPSNQTMHGVKARYDHLGSQRTQLYGNLWYRTEAVTAHPEWEDLVIRQAKPKLAASLKSKVKSVMPASMKALIKNRLTGGNHAPRKI